MRQPLGIVAGITPFNFPAMIPMWMFGVAIACGNAFILKPSERDPSVPVRLAELMKEAGLPDGILQVVHGDKEMVDAILDHDDIKAVSFVGSSDIAHYIYSRGTANGKRVQAFGGAKNHGIVMPDADLDMVVNDLAGAAFGSAGERCMALPVVVPVGEKTADDLREKLIPAIDGAAGRRLDRRRRPLRPGRQRRPRQRIENYIQMCADEGGELVVDGRGFTLQGHEEGFFIGPTLFDHVKPQLPHLPGGDFRPGAADRPRRQLRGGAPPAVRAPVRQRRRHLHPQRPRRARVRGAGQCRHGRHQRADPGAGRLSHASAAGSARASATSTSTAWKASASGPRPRPSPSAGRTAA